MNARTALPLLLAALLTATPVVFGHPAGTTVDFTDPAYTLTSSLGPGIPPCSAARSTTASLSGPWTGPVYVLSGHSPELDGVVEQAFYGASRITRDDFLGLGTCATSADWAVRQAVKAHVHADLVSGTGEDVELTWDSGSLHDWATDVLATLDGDCVLYLDAVYAGTANVDDVTGTCGFLIPALAMSTRVDVFIQVAASNPNAVLAPLFPVSGPIVTSLAIATATGPAHADTLEAALTP